MENSLVERDRQVIWHPYTSQKSAPDPIGIIRGEGVYLVDAAGNYYIDAISSWWVNLHGHAHAYIAEKIYLQAKTLEQVIFAGFTHEPAVQLAERLLPILPGDFSKIFYSDNGSTAVEVAIKMAIQYWWNESRDSGAESRELGINRSVKRRNKILAFKHSYHGDTFGAMSISDRGIFTLAFHDKLFDVVFIDPAHLPDIIQNLSKGIADHSSVAIHHSPFSIPLNEIACFIYEPMIQGAGGMKTYEAESLNALLKAFQEQGIICIADEVMTGFGRTGRLFASEYMQYKPDIVCLSKGLTGGTMALGVTACSRKIHDAFISEDKLKTFFHGHSFTANPLACSAALASLDLLQQQECILNIDRICRQQEEFAENLINAFPDNQHRASSFATKNHRCCGTIMAFEIDTAGKDEYLNDISRIITQKALAKGIFIRPLGNTVYIMPPYCITEDQLQNVYNAIVEILKKA